MIKKTLIMLLCCACSGMVLGQKKTGPSGAGIVIQQGSVKADSMWVSDPAKDKTTFVKPNKDGQFILTFTAVFPRTVRFGIDHPKKWNLSVFLEKGDEIKVNTDFDKKTEFSGKGAENARLLYEDAMAANEAYEKVNWEKISANELLEMFSRLGDHSIKLLEERRQKLSAAFYKEQSVALYYKKRGSELTLPLFCQGYLGRKLSASIPDNYWSLGDHIKMDEQLLSNESYASFIAYQYPVFLRLKALSAKGSVDSVLSSENKVRLDFGLIEEKYTGKIRSMALAKTLESGFSRVKDVEVFKPLLDQYLASYAGPEDAKKVSIAYQNFSKTNVGKVPPFFTLKDERGKDRTLKDFAGKVVYMDFWASWCSPCRYEMKNGSPKLHEKFKDNKDVVFLYVSIDDRADLWKKAIAEDKVEGVHVLSAGGFKSPVGQAFNINGVPHYIIIGKDGKIFDNNAPRPSQEITAEKIRAALNAK